MNKKENPGVPCNQCWIIYHPLHSLRYLRQIYNAYLSARKWQGSSQINLQQNDRLINGHIVFEGFNIACQTVHLNLFKMHNVFFADCLSLMHTRQERIHRKQIKTERNRLKSSIKAFWVVYKTQLTVVKDAGIFFFQILRKVLKSQNLGDHPYNACTGTQIY